MAITADVKNVKVSLKLAKGSQTISDCSKTASFEGLYGVAMAVAGLLNEELEAVTKVPGRFELIPTNRNINIIIDYAHTPDGFEKVLETINKFYEGRKIIVFGCVGERDRTKRSVMGKIAEQYCDLCVLTTDNCRSEDPEKIIDDIKQGFINGSKSYIEILDRAEAIRHAILHSIEKDTIIITGKGHERRQIIGDSVMTFNEREIIEGVLNEISATTNYDNLN